MTSRGKLIVIDAIDGAGKTTAIKAVVDHLGSQGKRTFDLVAWSKSHHALPDVDEPELMAADVMLSAEPTHTWVGAAVREELMRQHANRVNDGFIVAEGYSLDRYVLFTRVILPFLTDRPDRWVIQDRGVVTTLAYQPVQDERITVDWLSTLSGNRLELANPPDALILLRIMPEEAFARLAKRTDKQDNDIYSSNDFQARVATRYRSDEVLAPFRQAGTKIVEIDASRSPEEVSRAIIAFIQTL